MIAPASLLLRRPVPAILSRRALVALVVLAAVASAACDKVPLTAPTGSTVTLFSNTTIVPVNVRRSSLAPTSVRVNFTVSVKVDSAYAVPFHATGNEPLQV